MDQIRKGKNLRKVDQAPSDKAAPGTENKDDLASLLAKRLNQMSKGLRNDERDDESNDEWGDNP